MIRKATAVWRGTGREGDGDLTTDSRVLSETPYSFKTRFENQKGTNPEELLADYAQLQEKIAQTRGQLKAVLAAALESNPAF